MDKQAVLELLQKARKIIEHPDNWARGEFARDLQGADISWESPEAVCFCSLGALKKADGKWTSDSGRYAAGQLAVHMIGEISYFNDTRSHAEVLAAWDATIAKLQSEINQNRSE